MEIIPEFLKTIFGYLDVSLIPVLYVLKALGEVDLLNFRNIIIPSFRVFFCKKALICDVATFLGKIGIVGITKSNPAATILFTTVYNMNLRAYEQELYRNRRQIRRRSFSQSSLSEILSSPGNSSAGNSSPGNSSPGNSSSRSSSSRGSSSRSTSSRGPLSEYSFSQETLESGNIRYILNRKEKVSLFRLVGNFFRKIKSYFSPTRPPSPSIPFGPEIDPNFVPRLPKDYSKYIERYNPNRTVEFGHDFTASRNWPPYKLSEEGYGCYNALRNVLENDCITAEDKMAIINEILRKISIYNFQICERWSDMIIMPYVRDNVEYIMMNQAFEGDCIDPLLTIFTSNGKNPYVLEKLVDIIDDIMLHAPEIINATSGTLF